MTTSSYGNEEGQQIDVMKKFRWKSYISPLALSLILGGCAALPFVIPPLIEFAGGMIKTALNNYDKPYNQDLQQLMMSLQQQKIDHNSQGNTGQGFSQDSFQQDDPNAQDQGFAFQNDQGQSFGETDQVAQGQFDNGQFDDQNAQQPFDESSFSQDQAQFEGQGFDQSIEQPGPISLDVLLVRKTIRNGAVTLLPIHDGDVMRDGRGNAQAGDKFRIMFRANSNSYVYVIAIDGSAWAQGVFPPPGNPFANPVRAGEQYVIPEGDNWFSLDQFKGIETIFFVASQEKRADIETIMTRISGHERNPSDTPQQVTEAPIIPQGFAGARRSRSPFAIQTDVQQDHQLLPTTFFANTAGEALRVTRWFRHQ